MIRLLFFIYWGWHLCWLYIFFFDFPIEQIDAQLFTAQGYLNWAFISLLPSIVFILRDRSFYNDYTWWKMCMISAVMRSVFMVLAFYGYRYYFAGFLLTIFAIGVLLLLDKSFKKNSDSIKII